MGGRVPLGYRVEARKLIVDKTEAGTVRHIFERYLELGTVVLLLEDLRASEIVHHDKVYLGEHQAILPAALFDAVQEQLLPTSAIGAAASTFAVPAFLRA